MKKFTAVFLALIMLIVSTSSTYTYAAKVASNSRRAAGCLENVKYDSGDSYEAAVITVKNYTDYNVMTLSNPQRIVLDIFNVAIPGKQQIVKAEGKVIKSIRYAQFDTYTTRVVLDVTSETKYGVEKTDTGLVLYTGASTPSLQDDISNQTNTSRSGDSSGYGNSTQSISAFNDTDLDDKLRLSTKLPASSKLKYYNTGDRVHFILRDAALTKGDEFLEELYTGFYDDTGNIYTMTFATGKSNLGNGVMEINDKYLRALEVKTNKAYGTTTLTFYGTGRNTYFAYTRGTSGVTSITVIRPSDDTQKLVVIDAGHGGDAAGAVYGKLYEKNLNLDIAKRLNELLKKKGAETYMLREDDSNMGNYERAYIANHLNAKLYLSIHNNALDNRNYRGTMTLYCPSSSGGSFTGRSFAKLIHQTVLGSLKTKDRKVIGRSDLIVLKTTTMPAALIEVGYMTNKSDRSNLQKTSFRQKTAQALCDSIIKALAKLN